jgi:protein-L-isoaspartate(D-aspartate) O-methyltransferase
MIPWSSNAMKEVDRKDFVPEERLDQAYEDGPLPIGNGQTISQPYIVAYMAQALGLHEDEVVLEIGTGCGYNAAVLSRIASHVYSMEIIETLIPVAENNLKQAGIENVSIRCGDGSEGWPDKGPFDAIMLTAASDEIPIALKDQLRPGGSLIAPVGKFSQQLIRLTKTDQHQFREEKLIPVQFVPLTGNGSGQI